MIPTVVDNFISYEKANKLKDYFKSIENFNFEENKFFHWKHPNGEKISEEAQEDIDDILSRILIHINEEFKTSQLELKRVIIQTYEKGPGSPVHVDEEYAEMEDGFKQISYSAIVYLNDNYEGGEIHFPKDDYKLKPKAGTMIFFHGDLNSPHGVLPVVSGDRTNIVIFFRKKYE